MLNIEKHFSKLANYCGFKIVGERGCDPLAETMKLLDKDTSGSKVLADSLLYEYYDDTSGVAFNKGTIGCWFEINPLVGSDDNIEKNLTLFFNEELPLGGVLQFLIVASNDISHILDMWEEPRTFGGKGLAKLTAYRRNFIENAAKDFANARDGRLARNYRSFVTYANKDNGDKSVEDLLRFKKKLSNKLKAENLSPRSCTAQDLISVGRDMLQMSLEPRITPKYNILNNISNQIVEPFIPNTVEAEQITHCKTGLVSKIFHPQELPASFSLAEMVGLLGDDNKTIPARFIISYAVANNLGKQGTSALLTQGVRSIHAARKSYTQDDLVAKEEAGQWVEVNAMHKRGEVFLQESMLVMITAPKDDIDIAEEMLKSLYNAKDWKLNICSKVQRITSLAMLPMMPISYWKALKTFKLTRYALSGEVVAKLPIQGEWKGVPTSGALLIGRYGQLFNFNPFYRIGGGGNYNICMMAPSGSGKSFFLQELVQSLLAQNTAVFVMDIGGSYKNICKLLDGEMVRFNQENKVSLNPFATLSNSGATYFKALELIKANTSDEEIREITGLSIEKIEALRFGKSGASNEAKEKDAIELIEIDVIDTSGVVTKRKYFVTKDSVVYAKSMISAMCNVTGDGRGEAIIERAIIRGVGQYGQELDITKLSSILDNLKDNRGNPVEGASSMSDSLYPYTENGIHGRFFSSGSEASFQEMLTVFEFEELVNDEPLLAVVLQVILMQITMQFLCGDRTRRFMLIVDEAWMILDYASSFLERFARTVRKYGGSLVVCTQDLTSFSNECGTRKSQAAILECSTWKLILQQKEEGLESFAKSKAYHKYLNLISSVRKCSSNKFSEVLINTDGATIVGRFAADPYSTALFSTESKDYAFLLEQERSGVSKHEAILALSKQYGNLPELEENN